MTALTRRLSDNEHQETWHIYSGDVRIGAIGIRTGVPTSADQWGWSLGFYPGMEPGRQRSGSSATFDEARAVFERAWLEVEPTLREDDFEAWRRDRDFHAWKDRMQAAGCRMPTQNANGWSKCFCGEPIPIACDDHIRTVHRGIGA
ncbi:hypothetical protein [Bradyrhizobium japonicum]|uniref:hypothetical protein n=1 Tax=Bradyrhizobium japonicum TaxID=375 RepID=UPI001E610A93|nr:hypothetical protein [Bradyrhizobium japonicum]MCD9817679.1 hypothetical protein [Bradyrhizobium japonicum]MEB2672478.1 hypothetical protein [Bradyrhizobium japonicum]WRI91739.1 hypothetical protein R3F75_12760 [Bradyrhizobium japonicum]